MIKNAIRLVAISTVCLCWQDCLAQVGDSSESGLEISGFADVFYIYDFNRPTGTSRQDFLFNHNRHNEFNLNLGLIRLGYHSPKYRVNLALQSGTYAIDNYAAEPGLLRNIFEANVGVSLFGNGQWWLDAGILPSHLGFESAISSENPTLTRSLVAETSPYFSAGAQLTFTPDDRWTIRAIVMNGWQRIQRLEGNSMLSFGTQLQFSPSEHTTWNWSTFLGTDDPDISRRLRYFSNLYGVFDLSENFSLIAGADLGIQQISKDSGIYDLWFGPTLIGRYRVNEMFSASLRAEHYQDPDGVVVSIPDGNGFRTTGLSLNLDYLPSPNVICRIEGRWLGSRDEIFETVSGATDRNFIVATSIAVKFSETLGRKDR